MMFWLSKVKFIFVEYQNEVFVKRLGKLPLSLIGDNKDCLIILMEADELMRIIGRVVE